MKTHNGITDLFSDKIWTIDTDSCSIVYAEIVKIVKLVRVTVGTFVHNSMGLQCVALSYFVTLALIPFVAFIFAISGTLGLSLTIADTLYHIFPGNPDFVDTVLDRALNMIDMAKGGGPALVSALIFLWAIIWMMFQVEKVFNNVWGIRKIPRKIYKRFSFYLLVLLLSPFLLLIFTTGIAYYSNATKIIGLDLSQARFISQMMGVLAFYAVTVFTLSALYKFIPATKVKYGYALRSAIFAAIFFVGFQYLYLKTQTFVGRLNSAYGVIAAIPLFLIWVNFSWQIIIYGAELTYGYHNLDTVPHKQ